MEGKTRVRNWGEPEPKTGWNLCQISIPDLEGIEATAYHHQLFSTFTSVTFSAKWLWL